MVCFQLLARASVERLIRPDDRARSGLDLLDRDLQRPDVGGARDTLGPATVSKEQQAAPVFELSLMACRHRHLQRIGPAVVHLNERHQSRDDGHEPIVPALMRNTCTTCPAERATRSIPWYRSLLEHGLVRPSFVPPPGIRRRCDLTRLCTTRGAARDGVKASNSGAPTTITSARGAWVVGLGARVGASASYSRCCLVLRL